MLYYSQKNQFLQSYLLKILHYFKLILIKTGNILDLELKKKLILKKIRWNVKIMSKELVKRLFVYYQEVVSKSKNHSAEKEWKYHEYIKRKSEAERNGEESFIYKNITYVQSLIPSTPCGVLIYVRKQNYEP